MENWSREINEKFPSQYLLLFLVYSWHLKYPHRLIHLRKATFLYTNTHERSCLKTKMRALTTEEHIMKTSAQIIFFHKAFLLLVCFVENEKHWKWMGINVEDWEKRRRKKSNQVASCTNLCRRRQLHHYSSAEGRIIIDDKFKLLSICFLVSLVHVLCFIWKVTRIQIETLSILSTQQWVGHLKGIIRWMKLEFCMHGLNELKKVLFFIFWQIFIIILKTTC